MRLKYFSEGLLEGRTGTNEVAIPVPFACTGALGLNVPGMAVGSQCVQ